MRQLLGNVELNIREQLSGVVRASLINLSNTREVDLKLTVQ